MDNRLLNLTVTVPSADLAAAYTQDFEQLWQKQHVLGTGKFDDLPAALSYAARRSEEIDIPLPRP